MNSRDVVVRIIQPLDKPQPQRVASLPVAGFPVNGSKEENIFHLVLNGAVLAGIAMLAVFLGVSFFHLGVSFNDIMVIVGLPMALGIVTSYAIF
jgi:predicted phage tail protein